MTINAQAVEVNFDGLVGPTHNYAGLSFGNVASAKNAQDASNPKEAALQGLQKMKALADMGMVQAILPPHPRPYFNTLKALGFGAEPQIALVRAAQEAPALLSAVSSASNMWVANAATVSPSADTVDGRVHFTPANLSAMFHRSIEPPVTASILKAIFADPTRFCHHDPLPGTAHFGDEGAANHTRLTDDYGAPAVELFVYGAAAFDSGPRPEKFPARHTLEASQAVARLHGLKPEKVVYAQQHPKAIDAGVFHNDVIAVGNGPVLFYHEMAFLNEADVLQEIRQKMSPVEPVFVRVSAGQVPLADAVKSYVFNTQLLSVPGTDGMTVIAPLECQETPSVKALFDSLVADAACPIQTIRYLDVRQSMRNGGGPACLRLRVVLTPQERAAISARVFMDDALYKDLCNWVERHYRSSLTFADLSDVALYQEVIAALQELTEIMRLGPVYPFQHAHGHL